VDILHEEAIYPDTDFAYDIISDAWLELGRRQRLVTGEPPYVVVGRSIERRREWREACGHSFCVFLSLLPRYASWATRFGPDYTTQGSLFERLADESLRSLGWSTFRTGWSPSNRHRIKAIVEQVGMQLGETTIIGAIEKWMPELAK